MPQKSDPKTRLADAALRILAKKAWIDVSLAEIAKAAKVPLAELPAYAPAKPALVGLVLRRINAAVTKSYRAGRDADARDRLFDVAMAWFDALGPHKTAVRSLYRGLRGDPLMLVAVRDAIAEASAWLMTLAEADKGPVLSIRALAFAVVLGRAIPVWLNDDADLSKTMARLDADLRWGENVLGRRD